MWRQFSLSLGFRFSFFVFFIHFPWYYWLYLNNQHEGGEYTLTWSPSGISLLAYLNKSHIGVVSNKIWIIDCHDVLPICNFHTFWEVDKVRYVNLNIPIKICLWIKPKGLLIWILSLYKLYKNWCVYPSQKLGLMRATKVIVVFVIKFSKLP